jgi:Ricin-type beta-trefoil lectin domain-like
MKHVVCILIAFALAISFTSAQVTISTPPKDGSWVKIRVVQTGKYLAVENASKENGARIIQLDFVGNSNQKFQVKKNEDGTYSFFAAHSSKSICADKGDNREGDIIIQNTLSQFFGKWHLTWMNNCGQGWKMQYKSSSGKPLQVTDVSNGAACQLIEPLYHDGDVDCPYIYVFEPVDAPPIPQQVIKSHVKPKGVIIKGQNKN